jgi:hypothetical protein
MRTPHRSPITPGRIAAATTFVVLLSLTVLAPAIVSGARFGHLIERILPATCGRIHVGGGRWTWGTALALLRHRPAWLMLTDVVVTDPAGTEVMRIRKVVARLELSRDHRHATIHDLRVEDAAWRFARTADGKGVGFLMALAPACAGPAGPPSGGSRAPASTSSPRPRGVFEVSEASLDGLDVSFDLPGWGLDLKDVHASARLTIPNPGATGGPVSFEVWGADARGGGQLRVLDGAAALTLPFARATLKRVATTAARPDAILIEASTVTGRSTLALAGAFTGVMAAAAPGDRQAPGLDLAGELANADDAVQAVLTPHAPAALKVRGGADGARLALRFHGPFARVSCDVRARDFAVEYRDIDLRGVGFAVAGEPSEGRLRLSGLTVGSAAGGRLEIDARLEQRRVTGTARFDHFATRSLLPPFLLPLLAGTLQGTLRGRLDLANGSAIADELALTLARPPGATGPSLVHIAAAKRGHQASRVGRERRGLPLRIADLRFVDGTLYLPEVSASLWGGRVTARGKLTVRDRARGGWLPAPLLDLSLRGERISFAQLTGVAFLQGATSFRAAVNGPLSALDIRVGFSRGDTLLVLGQPFRLPAELVAHLAGKELLLPRLQLFGADGGTLTTSGSIDISNRLDLHVAVDGFPVGKLPGLAQTTLSFGGHLDGRLRLFGDSGRPAVSGYLSVDEVSMSGRNLGVGALTITPGPDGAIRVRGHLGAEVTTRGTLTPAADGLHGEATVELHRLRLDPFLFPALPGGATAAGVVSGSATARIAPGHQPAIAGRLTELALTVTGRGAVEGRDTENSTAARIALHAVGDVPLSAQAAGGPMKLGPARFAGDAGAFEVAAEWQGHRETATLRGHVNVTALGPLVAPWLDRLSGEVELDLAVLGGSAGEAEAEAKADAGHGARANAFPRVTGRLEIARPISFRPLGTPVAVQLTSGRIDLAGARATTKNLLARLGNGSLRLGGELMLPPTGPARIGVQVRGELDARLAEILAPAIVHDASGAAHLEAELGGTLAEPTIRLTVELARPVQFTLPAFSPDRIRLLGGTLELDGPVLTLRSLGVDVGSRIKLRLGDGSSPGILSFSSPLRFREVTRLALPVRGEITGLSTAMVQLDRASFSARLSGDPRRRLILVGEVQVDSARVSAKALGPSRAAGARPASTGLLGRLASGTELDVRLRARGGGLVLDVPHVPDPHLDVDLHIGGTLGHPDPTGQIKPAGMYSFLALLLYKLWR